MSREASPSLDERLASLEAHLAEENPVLQDAVRSFRKLDRVARGLGVLDREQSFATRVSWWPLISILGTFSSGKSTFINHYIGQKVQSTGNQAVDDKFTVICFGREDEPRVLPGRALDSEPRFPFYRISASIDEVIAGEIQRLDVYLQLKTCNSERLRGKILIDSPGFDADAQRTSTLRITDHIIDLSDLVLVFFDARHPEPGAMRDTLDHLVTQTLERADFNKFLYILNQIDSAAREDNPEQVFGAWQRALAQKGLTAGRFYSIYDPDSAAPIPDESLRRRFESKRETDMRAISQRMDQVNVERAYRIAGMLEETANVMSGQLVAGLYAARDTWRRRVLLYDALLLGVIALAAIVGTLALGYWAGPRFQPPWTGTPEENLVLVGLAIALALVLLGILHALLRQLAGRQVLKALQRQRPLGIRNEWLERAFDANLRSKRPFFLLRPRGYGRSARKALASVKREASRLLQALNDRFLLLGLLVALTGCVATVESPSDPPPADARAVLLLDHGYHSSLVLGRVDDRMVRYVYGEWRWYALGETGFFRVFPTLLVPTQAALGRRVLAGPATRDGVRLEVRVGIDELHQFYADPARTDALIEALDALFQANRDTLHYNPMHDVEFVEHPERYRLGNNSNHYVADWLRQLGIEVRGSPMIGRWRVED
jgi:hypothetical protein